MLVAVSPSRRAAAAAAIYSLSSVALFTISAAYHRHRWTPRARALMRRLDHAAIFLLIAGTYTPLCLLGLPPELGNRILAYVWAGAAVGLVVTVFWVHAPKPLTAILCLAVGWTLVPYLSAVGAALGPSRIALMLSGGIFYSLGAVAYAAKRPNPLPGVFGYHEVFHACTLAASVAHFALVLGLVRKGAC